MNNRIEYYNLKKIINKKTIEIFLIVLSSIVLIYLLIALYFTNHFYFRTKINNVDVSLKSYEYSEELYQSYPKNYSLRLILRDHKTEYIKGQEIHYKYRKINSLYKVLKTQKPIKWIGSLFQPNNYFVKDLYIFDRILLKERIAQLNCLQGEIILPENVGFEYTNGSYHLVKEVSGNLINLPKLEEVVKQSIFMGMSEIDLDKNNCYENPRYTTSSEKTTQTKNLLDYYVSSRVTYQFGDALEVVDGSMINQWLIIDNNLDVEINVRMVRKYIQSLSKKYDTIGITRDFKTSLGTIVKVKGGLFGYKINQEEEVLALVNHINKGEKVEKEPSYLQKGKSRGDKEIGDTYVEINITRQYLWFYKDGKLLAQGAVVTGNPNRGNATVLGTNMLNYKQKGVSLTGPGYEVGVSYWMPFYGNIGIHDAGWRHSFGGEIYKRRGSHGCVNAPKYLAKIIYENIEAGIPIISYEEAK